ncbi:MAG: aminoacyl-tRNA hydrolase, partial [Leuconostoc mesenteroides]
LGHPVHEQNVVVNYVLGKFTAAEKPDIDAMLDRSTQAIADWIQGATAPELSNRYNG